MRRSAFDQMHRYDEQHWSMKRSVAWPFTRLLALALAVYFGISAVAADRLSRRKRSIAGPSPATVGLSYHDIRFPAHLDNVPIAGWYIPHEGNGPAVIMVHGLDSSRATEYDGRWVEVAEALWQAGFSVLMIDLRGHGRSGNGRLSFGLRERRDVRGGVNWLQQQGYSAGQIGILGVSLGGAAALGCAAESPEVGAVATDAVFAEAEPVIRRAWPEESGLPGIFWPSTRLMSRVLLGYDPAASRPVEEIARVSPRPVLLIHGSNDELVLVEHAYRLQAVHHTAQLWMVAGAGHGESLLVEPDAYKARVADFFRQALVPATPTAQ